MVMEIELKLLVAPEHLARLRRHPLLRAGARGKPVSRRVFAEYYDTEDFALQRAGVVLRLRREGRRIVQTVKLEGIVEGGLHQRPEWEVEVHDGQLNFAALAQAGWSKPLSDPDLQRRLRPMFATEFRRTQRMLEPSPGSVMEFCLDQGEIRAGNHTLPISEIEIELRSGAPSALYDLAIALDRSIPLKLERRSKAERGYHLLRVSTPQPPEPPQPIKAVPIKLTGKMSVAAAFTRIVFDCLAHLQANEAGTLARQGPEYLHQMRVAVRRLRSAFGIFRSAFSGAAFQQHAAELRWLGQTLGPARDWDVFSTKTLPEIGAQFPDHAGIAQVAKSAAQARAAAGATAVEAITSRRYQRLLLLLSAWLTALLDTASAAAGQVAEAAAEAGATAASLADPASAATTTARQATDAMAGAPPPVDDTIALKKYASRILSKRHKQVHKRGRKLSRLGADERHQLRIAVKKLRYASEFFSSLYAKGPVRKYTAALAGLQEVLGALNDAATTPTLPLHLPVSATRKHEAKVEQGAASFATGNPQDAVTIAGLHEAAGIIAGFSAAQAKVKFATLDKLFNTFRRAPTFW
ncbi:MAG: CHAD domain-containing protein [Casimicrobiaceae bacterium]